MQNLIFWFFLHFCFHIFWGWGSFFISECSRLLHYALCENEGEMFIWLHIPHPLKLKIVSFKVFSTRKKLHFYKANVEFTNKLILAYLFLCTVYSAFQVESSNRFFLLYIFCCCFTNLIVSEMIFKKWKAANLMD